MHSCGYEMASFRYRAAIPLENMGPMLVDGMLNNPRADVLVFAKPMPEDVPTALQAHEEGRSVIVDFCDDHFDHPHYERMAHIADVVTCPTEAMADVIRGIGYSREIVVIPDPYEYPEAAPHCAGANLLWFGHNTNIESLMRVIRMLDDYPLMIVSNTPWAMPWSEAEMKRQLAAADIVVIPATAPYKSPNRAVEAVRQGCFVVAEPHPSLVNFPGIWVGNLKEGIEWARQNLSLANERTKLAQDWVRERFSARTSACAWKTLCERVKSGSTSEAARSAGPAGSMSMEAIPQPT